MAVAVVVPLLVSLYLFGWVLTARQLAWHRWAVFPDSYYTDSRGEAAGLALIWPLSAFIWGLYGLRWLVLRVLMGDIPGD